MAKIKCFRCAGFDPLCDCKYTKKSTKAKQKGKREREEFIALIWIKCWKFAIKFNFPPQSHEYLARQRFGPWCDEKNQRYPVPEEVKKLVKIGL